MDKLKIKIHPLFIAFGIYFAFTGKVFSFIIYSLSALLHELGHYLYSEKLGYALKNIVLMPYGAIISGDIYDLKYKDEILISLAGPFINLIISVFFVALWWVFPETYPYTELIVTANFSLFLINLLPCYPLDGGRFLLATLSLFLKRTTAKKIVKILGGVLGLTLTALFIYSLFISPNFTLLFFSLFIFVGAFSQAKNSDYVRIYSNLNYKKQFSVLPVKSYFVNGEVEIKKLYPLLNGEYYYKIEVSIGDKTQLLQGEELYKIISTLSPYDKIKTAIKTPYD